MVMFVLNRDGTPYFNFNIKTDTFKKGQIIMNERLEGKYEVVYIDMVTVHVKPLNEGK